MARGSRASGQRRCGQRSIVSLAVALALVLALLIPLLPAADAKIGLTPDRVDLGKVDPGHASTHTTTITNTDTGTLTIQARAECGCPLYVQVAPEDFTLAPGESQDVTIDIDVPLDADPGIHDNRVSYTEVADAGVGGTAQGALAQNVVFYVRTAKLFVSAIDEESDPPSAFIRFVNAYASSLDVTVTGTLTGPDGSHVVAPITFTAEGSPERSRSHQSTIALPSQSEQDGTYDLVLQATWDAAGDAEAGEHAPGPFSFVRGEPITLEAFDAEATDDGILFSGRLVHQGTDPVEAFMEVQIQERGRPDTITLASQAASLDPGTSQDITLLWTEPTGSEYDAVGVAGFRFAGAADIQRGTASESINLKGPGPSTDAEGSVDGRDGDDSVALDVGSLPPALLMVGVGVGAAALGGIVVWAVTKRRQG